MPEVADGSVALVVTSPPYFAGKQYEEELEREGVPGSYLEYLQLLTDVFAECVRTLEPGGRIAVNVANLGRKPYRSLSADVVRILQDELGLLLRGEVCGGRRVTGAPAGAVGILPERVEPRAAGPDRAGRRGQQGPLRPGPVGGAAEVRGAALPQHAARRTTSSRSPSTCGDPR